MTSLEQLLGSRRMSAPKWRSTMSGTIGGSSNALRRLANRLIWPRSFRHMRFLPSDITLDLGTDLRWTLSRNGRALVTSVPLRELVKPLDMPVSIVATGPSALEYPWDHVRNRERFLVAVNGAPTMLKDLGIKPDLLVVTDREFALTGKRHFEASPDTPLAIEYLAAAALASSAPQLLTNRPVAILERVNLWHGLPAIDHRTLGRLNEESGMPFVLPETPDSRCRIGWSHRPELGIFSGRTVVFGALQLAVGLGATDVEIIGMDLGGSGRSYAEAADKRPTQLQDHYESFILPSFRVMSLALAGRGVAVTNVSPVCPLPGELFRTPSGLNRTNS